MVKNNQAVSESQNKSNFILSIIKGILMSLAISLIAVCIFAFVLRFVNIPDSAIKPVNMGIKIVSVLLGTFFALKKDREMGLIKGLLIGALYAFLAFIIFSLLASNFSFSVTVLNDVIFGAVIGAISGIIAVNFKKK